MKNLGDCHRCPTCGHTAAFRRTMLQPVTSSRASARLAMLPEGAMLFLSFPNPRNEDLNKSGIIGRTKPCERGRERVCVNRSSTSAQGTHVRVFGISIDMACNTSASHSFCTFSILRTAVLAPSRTNKPVEQGWKGSLTSDVAPAQSNGAPWTVDRSLGTCIYFPAVFILQSRFSGSARAYCWIQQYGPGLHIMNSSCTWWV